MEKKSGGVDSSDNDDPLSSFSSYEEKEAYTVKLDVKEESLYDAFCAYLLILWDGPGFFGMNTAKLNRVKGEKVTFFTKC